MGLSVGALPLSLRARGSIPVLCVPPCPPPPPPPPLPAPPAQLQSLTAALIAPLPRAPALPRSLTHLRLLGGAETTYFSAPAMLSHLQ